MLTEPGLSSSPHRPGSPAPTHSEDTLLNPWTLPGFIRGRPILTPSEALDEGLNPFGRYDSVRWNPLYPPTASLDPDFGVSPSSSGQLPSLMATLKASIEFQSLPEGWDWIANKTILGIGDSLMRNNVNAFPRHLANGWMRATLVDYEDEEGKHWRKDEMGGIVNVPGVGLKVGNWFHAGGVEMDVVRESCLAL